jgi:SAM-dependent methyltransferase
MQLLPERPAILPLKPDVLAARNRDFYNALWAKTYLTRPERFNTWPFISSLLAAASKRLEIGPGLHPRLPIKHTHFVDISPPVVTQLIAHRGIARIGSITALPYPSDTFDVVAAFDVVEHVKEDECALEELTRVLKVSGHLIFSVPLHRARWTAFDDYVGHARRYEPAELADLLARHDLVVERSAVFGMQSNNPRLLDYAVKGLTRHHTAAMRCYNWFFFPLGTLLQKRLALTDGLMDLSEIDEVLLLICRRK